jgi:UDP-glucose 4-epimerase
MKRNALVTGGAGFVGSVLADQLLSAGWEVTIVDDLSNGKRENIPTGARFVQGDLADTAFVRSLAENRFETIFHVAAQASNAVSFYDPVRDLKSNQLATLNLLELARTGGTKRFLFASSMSAYGDAERFPTTEDEMLRPLTPYALHKAASEQYLSIYGNAQGLDWTVFRLYTTYGGRQNLDNREQGLLSIYLSYLLRGEPILVKGSLDRQRDIVHVNDVVGAMVSAVDARETFSEVYNLCSGESLSIRDIVHSLIYEVGEDPDTYPIIVEDGTPGDPSITHGSFAKAHAHFGYTPKVSPKEGIRLTVATLDSAGRIANES